MSAGSLEGNFDWKKSAIQHHRKMFELASKNEFRPPDEVVYTVMELCGEVGELANMMKKLMRGDKSVFSADDVQNLINEIADVRICIELVASTLSLNLDQICAQKVIINADKWAMKDMGVKGI